jgi:hypothetical protein
VSNSNTANSTTSTTRLIDMNISWTSRAYGWEGTLERLNVTRNDWSEPAHIRRAADRNYRKIVSKLADRKLMALRERLIKATQAKDERSVILITQQIRYYEHEDQETGLYE